MRMLVMFNFVYINVSLIFVVLSIDVIYISIHLNVNDSSEDSTSNIVNDSSFTSSATSHLSFSVVFFFLCQKIHAEKKSYGIKMNTIRSDFSTFWLAEPNCT